MMLSSSPHVAPRFRPSTEQIGWAGPPVMSTLLSVAPDVMSRNPTQRPSGERNGARGVPRPVSAVGSNRSIARTNNAFVPW